MTGFTDCTLFSRLIQSPISISKATRFVHYSDNEYPCLFPVFLFPLQIFLISALPVDAALRCDLDNAVCHSFQNLVVVRGQNDYALEIHQTVIDSGDALQIEVVGRSVQKQYVGVEQHHAGKHAANLFAAGQYLDRLINIIAGEQHSAQKAPQERFGFVRCGILADPVQNGIIVVIEVCRVIHRKIGSGSRHAPFERTPRPAVLPP